MSINKKFIPIAVLILFITVGISKAEPTPTISYLINTPVSMLDFGIYKLNKYFDSINYDLTIFGKKPLHKPVVSYFYGQNRIVIELIYVIAKNELNESDFKDDNIKKEIEKIIRELKYKSFGIDETGKPITGKISLIYMAFEHEGYARKDVPKNIGKELDQITEISVEFFAGKKRFKCKSPLIGNKIYWSK
jgi:hypothetical protein